MDSIDWSYVFNRPFWFAWPLDCCYYPLIDLIWVFSSSCHFNISYFNSATLILFLPAFVLFCSCLIAACTFSLVNGVFIDVGGISGNGGRSLLNCFWKCFAISLTCCFLFAVYLFIYFISKGVLGFILLKFFIALNILLESSLDFPISSICFSVVFVSSVLTRL